MAVDGVPGEAPILGMVKAMIGEALLVQVKDKGPDFIVADLRCLQAHSCCGKEVHEIMDAAEDDSGGIRAFPLGGGAELITLK